MDETVNVTFSLLSLLNSFPCFLETVISEYIFRDNCFHSILKKLINNYNIKKMWLVQHNHQTSLASVKKMFSTLHIIIENI